MKNEFKGSIGKAIITTPNTGNEYAVGITVGRFGVADVFKDIEELLPFYQANAELIAEAFNVVNECGLTPRQLAEQNKELLEACKAALERLDNDGKITDQLETAIKNAETI